MEALIEVVGILVSVVHRGLQVRQGCGPISTGQVDQRSVVMDHPQGFTSGCRSERLFQVGGRIGITTFHIYQRRTSSSSLRKPHSVYVSADVLYSRGTDRPPDY